MRLPLLFEENIYLGYEICRTPNPMNLAPNWQDPNNFYRKFNIYANGYVKARYEDRVGRSNLWKQFTYDNNLMGNVYYHDDVQYVGTQGRYYLTGVSLDLVDTVDFTHTMNIAGAQWQIGYFKRGVRPNGSPISRVDEYTNFNSDEGDEDYGADFQPGDKIKLISWGGVSGFPERGAKVKFAVSNPYTDYTDDLLEQVRIVPNPYVITHQEQHSPYGAKIYFTGLPPICDIDIFTASGDLVTSIKHAEEDRDWGWDWDRDRNRTGSNRYVDIWNLLSKNGQRVQSQTLIAVIKTPNGAMTTKHFSVIVGGFRVVTD
jgi:hypothetical protein